MVYSTKSFFFSVLSSFLAINSQNKPGDFFHKNCNFKIFFSVKKEKI